LILLGFQNQKSKKMPSPIGTHFNDPRGGPIFNSITLGIAPFFDF
jgi:hypothetical protein